MNNCGVPYGTDFKSFSSENTTIIHDSSAKRLHYSSFIQELVHCATAPMATPVYSDLMNKANRL
jgi:hypothetical protein